jgi:hypothetical protein
MAGLWDWIALVAAGKLLLHPGAVAAAVWLVGAEPRWFQGDFFAAMAMLTIYPILAGRVGLAASSLFVPVVLSLASITGIVALIGL